MEYIEQLLKVDWVQWVLVLIILLSSLTFLYELFVKVLSMFGITTKHKINEKQLEQRVGELESKEENLFKQLEEQNKQLQTCGDFQYEEIKKISQTTDKIFQLIEENEKRHKEETKGMLRNQLYALHSRFVAQNFVDQSGLTTFVELGNIYESCGGNDIYHEKLYPEVMSLELRQEK